MANNFLMVEKSLFGSGLSPIEMLVLSQIMEFNRTTGDCFMSNAVMAKNFGVSEKTVSRAMATLEEKGYIVRDTRNTQKGKERHITLAKDKMSLANNATKDKMSLAEKTNCPLPKGQNDSIKDNIKTKELKDNKCVLLPNGNKTGAVAQGQRSILPVDEKPFSELTHKEMVERFNRELGY